MPSARDPQRQWMLDAPGGGVRGRLACSGATGAVVGLASILLILAVVDPPSAGAEVPIVGPIVEGVGSIGHAVLHPADAALSALTKILQAVFGGVEAKFIAGVISALLAVPDFSEGNVAQLETTTVALAAGMLSAVLTLSIVRYYLAGLTDRGAGGFEALQGVVRVVGAVGFIVLWPGIFAELVQIPRVFNEALLNSGGVQHNVALLFDAALVSGSGAFAIGSGVGLIFVILIAFISAIVFLGLLWMKVLISVLLMFLYVSMPLVAVLWPVPELAWLAASAMKAMLVALIVPCVWAILFALAAAINTDILTWVPTHSILDTLIVRPLAGITLMLLCITIPRFLMRTAMLGPHGQGGGWRVLRTITLGTFAARTGAAAGRSVAGAAAQGSATAQRMVEALPAAMRPPSGPGEGSLAARAFFGASGYDARATQNGTSPTRQSQDTQTRPEGASEDRRQPTPAQQTLAIPGIPAPAKDQDRVDWALEAMQSRSRLDAPDAQAVAGAMASFAPETQRALSSLHERDVQAMRPFAAEHYDSPGLTDRQKGALLLLGSAGASEMTAGISSAVATLGPERSTGEGSPPTQVSGDPASVRAPAPHLAPSADGGVQPAPPQPVIGPAGQPGPSVSDARELPEDAAPPEPFLD